MSKVLLALTSAALLGLSGCADMQTKTDDKPAAAKATISAEAQAALSCCPGCCQGCQGQECTVDDRRCRAEGCRRSCRKRR